MLEAQKYLSSSGTGQKSYLKRHAQAPIAFKRLDIPVVLGMFVCALCHFPVSTAMKAIV